MPCLDAANRVAPTTSSSHCWHFTAPTSNNFFFLHYWHHKHPPEFSLLLLSSPSTHSLTFPPHSFRLNHSLLTKDTLSRTIHNLLTSLFWTHICLQSLIISVPGYPPLPNSAMSFASIVNSHATCLLFLLTASHHRIEIFFRKYVILSSTFATYSQFLFSPNPSSLAHLLPQKA